MFTICDINILCKHYYHFDGNGFSKRKGICRSLSWAMLRLLLVFRFSTCARCYSDWIVCFVCVVATRSMHMNDKCRAFTLKACGWTRRTHETRKTARIEKSHEHGFQLKWHSPHITSIPKTHISFGDKYIYIRYASLAARFPCESNTAHTWTLQIISRAYESECSPMSNPKSISFFNSVDLVNDKKLF